MKYLKHIIISLLIIFSFWFVDMLVPKASTYSDAFIFEGTYYINAFPMSSDLHYTRWIRLTADNNTPFVNRLDLHFTYYDVHSSPVLKAGEKYHFIIDYCSTFEGLFTNFQGTNVDNIEYIHNTGESCYFTQTMSNGSLQDLATGTIYKLFVELTIDNVTLGTTDMSYSEVCEEYGGEYPYLGTVVVGDINNFTFNKYTSNIVSEILFTNGTGEDQFYRFMNVTVYEDDEYTDILYGDQIDDGVRDEDEPETLLQAIKQLPKRFLDNLTTQIQSLRDTFSNPLENIRQAILGIATSILEGLRNLFVPTDTQLNEVIDDARGLAENFGFVGQSVSFFINIFTSFLGVSNGNGCVTLPEFSVGSTSLFEGMSFWQEQTVCLSDNVVLSTHINTIRSITTIVMVCLFLTFASRQFFSILSKNDSGTSTVYEPDNGNVTRTTWSNTNGNYVAERRKY